MKKNKENKNITPPPKSKSLDICMNCTSKYCPGSKNPIRQGKSNLAPETSKTSTGAKASESDTSNKCNCASYIDHVAMLDMVRDDDTCSCGILAQALRSNIHMNIGTLLHRDESECSEETVEKEAVEKEGVEKEAVEKD